MVWRSSSSESGWAALHRMASLDGGGGGAGGSTSAVKAALVGGQGGAGGTEEVHVEGGEKQRELAQKGSMKNGNVGSPVNQQPKKNNVMARTRLVIPNKGYSSLDQSPDEKPLVALDTDSDDDFDMSRYSSSGYSSAEINQDLNIQLLKDGYRLDEIPDDEDLDLIPPKSVNPTCMCCQATSSTACHIQ
ncbi:protein FAM219A-like isoform X2 [Poecile atricapillus]|uniref:protein FAM219A-like isoform X2 n=1 Tax=Poecile atricapillus TaxID=48891 RepID=UPI002738815D|nr:protein FAM219A-like isoform X2 [Poecile atricapillus]